MEKELAEKLNGIEYGDRIAEDHLNFAKENNLVIVTGYSDDNVEFEGAIYEEVPAYNGTYIALDSSGIIEECDEACDHCDQAKKLAKQATDLLEQEGDVVSPEGAK